MTTRGAETRQPWRWSALLAACWLALTPTTFSAESFVHDALSSALEGAEKHVTHGEDKKDGYTLRKDFWQGDAESGKAQAIKHQLIKGNSYWFWVGTDAEAKEMVITIFDRGKKPVQTAKVEKGLNWIGARIDVTKTDTYYIGFRIDTKDGGKADWAVAYAYK